jgi:hypothetical protein
VREGTAGGGGRLKVQVEVLEQDDCGFSEAKELRRQSLGAWIVK